jgi:S-disulfanyl-L-cysteine oxidoreductase SoxD
MRLLLLVAAMGLSACTEGGMSAESPDVAHTPERPASAGIAGFEGVGRDATPDEVAAWDIDVRPDFTGLPPGAGDVYTGEELWIEKCSSCHGDFGDANHVFVPLIGNTTTDDIETGRVASLASGGAVRTTFTKVATVSTLWDYIHRAMPWDAPKSLSHDEVYALLAYMLNLAEIVPMDYVLSHENIAEVQARMPNRNGMTRVHGLWKIDGTPDTDNTDCMRDCKAEVEVLSALPDYARPAHGNLADQNRAWGPIRGALTLAEGETDEAPAAAEPALEAPSSSSANDAAVELISGYGCQACHGMDRRIVGPGFTDIAEKYRDQDDAVAYLTDKIQQGGSGVWGAIPMPPQPQVSDEDAAAIANWIAAGAQP